MICINDIAVYPIANGVYYKNILHILFEYLVYNVVYSIYRKIYCIRCLYNIHYTANPNIAFKHSKYSGWYTSYSELHSIAYDIQLPLESVRYAVEVDIVQCILFDVQCTRYNNVRYLLYSDYYSVYS